MVCVVVKSEFPGLFGATPGIVTAIGQGDDFGARSLRLQQIGREIGRIQRVAHRADRLAAQAVQAPVSSRPVGSDLKA